MQNTTEKTTTHYFSKQHEIEISKEREESINVRAFLPAICFLLTWGVMIYLSLQNDGLLITQIVVAGAIIASLLFIRALEHRADNTLI